MSEENQTFQAAARPSGKRQATGAQTTVAKKPAREKVDELRKVIWPTGRQMVTYSIIVILFLIAMIALVWGVDTLAGLGVRSVLGK